MLNPNFRLPESWIMDKIFPEIKNPLQAQAQVRKEDAMMHPKAIIVDSIIAYREQARILRDANDVDSAALYEKLATSLEAELGVPAQGRGTAQPIEVPREVLPKEVTTPEEGLAQLGGL